MKPNGMYWFKRRPGTTRVVKDFILFLLDGDCYYAYKWQKLEFERYEMYDKNFLKDSEKDFYLYEYYDETIEFERDLKNLLTDETTSDIVLIEGEVI